MKLTSDNVEKVFFDCLFQDGEDTSKAIMAEGIMVAGMGFHPERLKKHEKEIYEMLKQLPKQFQKDGGGGWSFLNACNDKDDNQWTGLHKIMEQLFCLGIAIKKASYLTPREDWKSFPGGMPYIIVN